MKVLLAQGELVAARHEEATALGGADLVRPGLLLRECGILAFQKLEVGSGGALDGVVFGRARGGSLLAHEHSAEIAPVALERGRDVVLRAGEGDAASSAPSASASFEPDEASSDEMSLSLSSASAPSDSDARVTTTRAGARRGVGMTWLDGELRAGAREPPGRAARLVVGATPTSARVHADAPVEPWLVR